MSLFQCTHFVADAANWICTQAEGDHPLGTISECPKRAVKIPKALWDIICEHPNIEEGDEVVFHDGEDVVILAELLGMIVSDVEEFEGIWTQFSPNNSFMDFVNLGQVG
jgi:hypothetical protein